MIFSYSVGASPRAALALASFSAFRLSAAPAYLDGSAKAGLETIAAAAAPMPVTISRRVNDDGGAEKARAATAKESILRTRGCCKNGDGVAEMTLPHLCDTFVDSARSVCKRFSRCGYSGHGEDCAYRVMNSLKKRKLGSENERRVATESSARQTDRQF